MMINVLYVQNLQRLQEFYRRDGYRTGGHYYSQEAIEAKKLVFPADYDSTRMFWLIKKDGAYGARSGLLPVVKEVFRGIFKRENKNQENYIIACDYNGEMSCMSARSTIKRIVNMLKIAVGFLFKISLGS